MCGLYSLTAVRMKDNIQLSQEIFRFLFFFFKSRYLENVNWHSWSPEDVL